MYGTRLSKVNRGRQLGLPPAEPSASRKSQHRPPHYQLEGTNIMTKTLHNSDVSGARKNVKDIIVIGNGDTFALLCKASSAHEGWMKSTKAMEVSGGCVVQVTTQQRNEDGSYAVAEALTYVPGVKLADDEPSGRKLIPI